MSFTRTGKQILAHGYHYADAADERAAEFILAALNRDSDERRNGEDAQRLSGEATPARAGGIAQGQDA